MHFHSFRRLRAAALLLGLTTSIATGLTLDDEKSTVATLRNTVVALSGRSELHVTGGGDPIPGCTVHLNSTDGWVFFHQVPPSTVAANLLSRFRVDGEPAAADENVRVVQYVAGTVVIPHANDFKPLTVFQGRHLTGAATGLELYTEYDNAALGTFADNIGSFVLKRGYTATFAENPDGSGFSVNYVAQDSDLEVSILPASLDRAISFVRVFPWRWTSKKGSGDVDPDALNAQWHYNWNISKNSTRDWEYVAIRQQPYWPGLNQDWRARGVNHLLGFNEPDNPVEDAYKNLNPPGSVNDAVARWPELLATGLRVGAPAVTDGGYNWIRDFINRADAAGLRVDYVPVHYYRSYWNNNDPAGAANQLYNFLKSIHDIAQRPIWVTEFNNGANWTNNDHDPNVTQNREVIRAMIERMDETPWIERYAIYSRVEWFRQTHYDSGGLTPMGQMYRDHVAPIAYRQTVPNSGSSGNALYLFDDHFRDTLSGNNPVVYGTPTFVAGKNGNALSFDGTDDYLALPGRLGDSGEFSFAAWINWHGGDTWQRIFDLGDGTDRYLFLTPRSSANSLRFGIKLGGTAYQVDAPALTPGIWTHVAVTLADNTVKLFVNGQIVDTRTNVALRPFEIDTRTNFLGKSQWPADPLFGGLLDDVRFFNTGLTEADVAALAASAAPQFEASPTLRTAEVGLPFHEDLNAAILAAEEAPAFSKIGGPTWLTVSADGTVFGVPPFEALGRSHLVVRAEAPGGAVATATFPVVVTGGEPVLRYAFDRSLAATAGTPAARFSGVRIGYPQGHRGDAINLNGTSEFLTLPPGVASSDEITVATWVRWDGGNAWQRIFDFGNDTTSYLFLTPRSGSDTLRFAIRNGQSEQFVETAQLTTDTPTHVAVTLGPEGGRLYVDGALVADNPEMTIRPSDFHPVANYLGRSQFANDPYFDGWLDEFHLFHRALNGNEIQTLRDGVAPTFPTPSLTLPPATSGVPYEATLAGSATVSPGTVHYAKAAGPAWLRVSANGDLSGTPGPGDSGNATFRIRATSSVSPLLAADADLQLEVRPPADLHAHYPFAGSTGDATGAWDGTAHGSPDYVASPLDSALLFDGADDYVELPAETVAGLEEATFAIRFRWDGGAAWQRLFDFGRNTGQALFLTPASGDGTLRFSISKAGSPQIEERLETTAPPIGDWTHVAVVLADGRGTLYVNGAEAASGPIALDPREVSPTFNYIGKSQWPADPLFRGAIDDFRLFSRALDADEIRALAIPPGPTTDPLEHYRIWTATFDFPEGQDEPRLDPDDDGWVNLLEWLFGSHPLDPSDGRHLIGESFDGAEVGLNPEKTYFGFTVRVRRDRPGITLIPEGATTLNGLNSAESATRVRQAGPPVIDGEFEILTWIHETPINETDAAFMRLRVEM